MEKFIDTHAHYNHSRFKNDLDKVIEKVNKSTSLIINCGTNTEEINNTLDLVKKYENIYGILGFFPVDTIELETNINNLAWLEERLGYEKIIGLGEIGLDYHWNRPDKTIQKKWFNQQIELANKLHIPICIHSRDAEEDTVNILLENRPEYGCIIHCFSYGPRTMSKLCEVNAFFGIGGTSTYKGSTLLREAIKKMPHDRIILETDAPYLTPVPNRGKRNDSSNIIDVVKNLEPLLNLNSDEIIELTNKNALEAYPLLKKYLS